MELEWLGEGNRARWVRPSSAVHSKSETQIQNHDSTRCYRHGCDIVACHHDRSVQDYHIDRIERICLFVDCNSFFGSTMT